MCVVHDKVENRAIFCIVAPDNLALPTFIGLGHRIHFLYSTRERMEDDSSCQSLRESLVLATERDEGYESDENSHSDVTHSSGGRSLFGVWGDLFFPSLTPSLIHKTRVGCCKLLLDHSSQDPYCSHLLPKATI